MMQAVQNQRPRRQTELRKTAAFNLSEASLQAVNRLVERDVFPNKSAAVDEALRLLIAYHGAALTSPTNEGAA